jgi:hypothetical protein
MNFLGFDGPKMFSSSFQKVPTVSHKISLNFLMDSQSCESVPQHAPKSNIKAQHMEQFATIGLPTHEPLFGLLFKVRKNMVNVKTYLC